MTSPAISTMANERSGAGGSSSERRGRIQQAVSKVRERIRTATGRDGNGLKDAAKRVSETVRERMSGKGRSSGDRPEASGGGERRAAPEPAKKAAEMVKDKVSRVKSAVAASAGRS